LPDGTVPTTAAGFTPARSSCTASSSTSGPDPTSTTGEPGTIAAVFSITWAAPQVSTPGRVQPGTGTGRS